ncbi:MAG: transcriptional regulator [Marinilabiliales bacterium]|nr:MAG: transcriptional regulator [Marinilabiliales bacterium]
MHMEKIVKEIKDRRESLSVSQESLAELSGVGLRTLKLIESGKGNPTIKTLQKVVGVLGMEVCLRIKKIS